MRLPSFDMINDIELKDIQDGEPIAFKVNKLTEGDIGTAIPYEADVIITEDHVTRITITFEFIAETQVKQALRGIAHDTVKDEPTMYEMTVFIKQLMVEKRRRR